MATYTQSELAFLYPDNWRVIDEELDQWPRSVVIESPGGAIWGVHLYQQPVDRGKLVAQVLESLRAEYPGLESHVGSDDFDGQNSVGYDMETLYLDFVIAANVRGVELGPYFAVVTSQAEDREFQTLADVFRAMTISLIRQFNQK